MEGDEIFVSPMASMDGKQGLVAVDIVVLVIYFVLVLAVGLGVSIIFFCFYLLLCYVLGSTRSRGL